MTVAKIQNRAFWRGIISVVALNKLILIFFGALDKEAPTWGVLGWTFLCLFALLVVLGSSAYDGYVIEEEGVSK